MWRVWVRIEIHTDFWWGNPKHGKRQLRRRRLRREDNCKMNLN